MPHKLVPDGLFYVWSNRTMYNQTTGNPYYVFTLVARGCGAAPLLSTTGAAAHPLVSLPQLCHSLGASPLATFPLLRRSSPPPWPLCSLADGKQVWARELDGLYLPYVKNGQLYVVTPEGLQASQRLA